MDIITNKVLSFLKSGIEKTMRSYDRYTNSEIKEDEEPDFAKHHAACKQAISHLESLLKLYEQNLMRKDENEDKKSDTGKNLQSLIDDACHRIKNDRSEK